MLGGMSNIIEYTAMKHRQGTFDKFWEIFLYNYTIDEEVRKDGGILEVYNKNKNVDIRMFYDMVKSVNNALLTNKLCNIYFNKKLHRVQRKSEIIAKEIKDYSDDNFLVILKNNQMNRSKYVNVYLQIYDESIDKTYINKNVNSNFFMDSDNNYIETVINH
jgi:hypothetical protein